MNEARHLTLALADALARPTSVLAGVPGGFDGKVLADLLTVAQTRGIPQLLVIARDGNRLAELERSVKFFAPGTCPGRGNMPASRPR